MGVFEVFRDADGLNRDVECRGMSRTHFGDAGRWTGDDGPPKSGQGEPGRERGDSGEERGPIVSDSCGVAFKPMLDGCV